MQNQMLQVFAVQGLTYWSSSGCTATAFVGTYPFVMPLYKASAMLWVNNNSIDVGDVFTNGDPSASKNLVDSDIVILRTRETINEVIVMQIWGCFMLGSGT